MPKSIQDSVVVITGASSGIGRATALQFAEQGAAVVLAARREDALREVARECEREGGRALVVPTDVTDESAVQNLAQRAIETFGRIDVWVNNAAVTLFGRFEQTPPDAFRRVLETNLHGSIHGARAVIPIFREQGRGVLINVSSMVGKVGQIYTSAYVTSKWAINGLAECLRMELLDTPDIHVCNVLPASIDTPLFQQAANYSGRVVSVMPPVYDARKVARTIVQLVESPRREVFVGNSGRVLAALRTLAPAMTERLMARQVDEEHLEDRPAAPTAGNLFEPMPEYAKIEGGWKYRNRDMLKQQAPTLIAASLAGLGVGLVAWWCLQGSPRPDLERLRRQGLARLRALSNGQRWEHWTEALDPRRLAESVR